MIWLALMFREISDLPILHTFPPDERLALADEWLLNATHSISAYSSSDVGFVCATGFNISHGKCEGESTRRMPLEKDLKRDILKC